MEEHWGLRTQKLDICGDGKLHDVFGTPPLEMWGKFLAEVSGYQKVRFTNTWTGPRQANLQLLSYENGIEKPRTIWDIKFEPKAEAPMPIVVDVDKDGKLEIAVSHWYGVTIYDLYTGVMKYQNIYRGNDHGRQYGHFSAVNFPDGKIGLLVVGDFSPHISMLMVRNDKLEVLWFNTFENDRQQGIDRRVTINRVGPEPADDYDGDSQVEVMMNFFNGTGDSRWHLIGYDALNGQVKYDIEDFFMDGALDVDGDGRKEWIGRHYDGRALNTYAPLLILKPTGKNKTCNIWSCPRGRWSLHRILPRLTLQTFQSTTSRVLEPVSYGNKQGTEAVLFFSEPVGETNREKLSALKFHMGKPVVLWTVESSSDGKLDALSVRDKDVLIKLEQPLNPIADLRTENASLNPIGQENLTYFAPQPVVLKNGNKTHIIVATSAWQICCFQSQDQQEPKILWAYSGRPMATDLATRDSWFGLEAEDINNDGISEVLYVTENPKGGAQVLARNLEGKICWQYDFPEFCGYVAEWGDCMTTFWAVGHFIKADHFDVFVSNRRSTMHSDESVVIDTQKDTIVWHKDTLEVREPWTSAYEHTRGYGGSLPVIADFENDCLDDIVLTYPCELSIVKGKDGSQLFVENMGPVAGTHAIDRPDQTGFWLIGGKVLGADLDNDGIKESLVTHPGMIIAFKHHDKRSHIIWRTEPGDGITTLPAVADTDGDGVFELGLPGCRDGFRCVDSKTGRVLWNIGEGASSNCVACDIDGDGREEFLYANGKLLRAVRNGKVVWEINLLAGITQLAVADVDGDGTSEILAGAEDGKMYCIDG
jgi:outer membrane protein assembly factor BamB